jgi:hypothetical protein
MALGAGVLRNDYECWPNRVCKEALMLTELPISMMREFKVMQSMSGRVCIFARDEKQIQDFGENSKSQREFSSRQSFSNEEASADFAANWR